MTRLIIAVILAALGSAPAMAAKTLSLTTPAADPLSNEKSDGFIDQVVAEALNRMGYKLSVSHLPAERALINANTGIDDGDLNRIGGLSKVYPNLIQAKEATFTMQFVAFSKKANISTRNWETLRPYTIGLVTGWKILESNIPPGTQVVKVRNPDQLFYLLQKDRIDIALFGKWQGLEHLKKNHINDIHLLSPPLAEKDMFVYFHRKHESLVPVFDAALQKMKRDGSWQNIFNKTLEPLAR